jgi:AraC-like DNA-binding protein
MEDRVRMAAAPRDGGAQAGSVTAPSPVTGMPPSERRLGSAFRPTGHTCALTCFELDTDRRPEAIRVQRASALEGVEFWSISESDRRWAMIHDRFSAWWIGGAAGTVAGKWSWRGQERPLRAGSVLLMEPGDALVVEGSRVSMIVLFWEPPALDRAAMRFDLQGTLQWRLQELALEPIDESFRSLDEQLVDGDDPLAVEDCYLAIARDLLLFAGEGVSLRRPRGRWHPGVRRAVEMLNDRFAEPIGLDDLAAEARLSKFHLVRCFQETTGFTPHQYLKLRRVQEARRLLERGHSLGETAGLCGFADASHLSRTFRAWLGTAPGAWSRGHRASHPFGRHRPETSPPPLETEATPSG